MTRAVAAVAHAIVYKGREEIFAVMASAPEMLAG
jgi:hypothetical protein